MLIKFFFKLVIVFIIALAAVIYHNTESGKKFEKKVGEEINFERMSERGKDLLEKTIYFLSLKGLEYKKKKEAIEEKGPLRVKQEESPFHGPTAKGSSKEIIKKETTEKIGEEDRKKLEEILEQEG